MDDRRPISSGRRVAPPGHCRSLAGMNCPNCGAAMYLEQGQESLHCSYCTYAHALSANSDGVRLLPGEVADVACPVCRIKLQRAIAGSHELLCCPGCQGVLVAMGQFMKVVRRLRVKARTAADPFPAPAASELGRCIDCPQCGGRMNTYAYGGPGNIVIDNCPRCALNWLDHRELERVVTAPDASPNAAAWATPDTKGISARGFEGEDKVA